MVTSSGRSTATGALRANSLSRLKATYCTATRSRRPTSAPVEPSRLIAVQLLKEKLDIRFHDSGEAGRPSLVAVGAAQEGEIKEIIGIVDKISLVGGCRQVFDFYRLESEDQIDAVPRDRFLYLRSHFGVGHR